jgi:hypothetical protein
LGDPPAHTSAFLSFLSDQGIRGGRALIISCHLSAAHLSKLGFETHLVAGSLDGIEGLRLQGAHAHAQSLTGPLLFEDSFFDIVIDAEGHLPDHELRRVMAKGAVALSGRSGAHPSMERMGRIGGQNLSFLRR